MKTIVDYLKENKRYIQDIKGLDFELELVGNYIILKCKERGWWWRLTPHLDFNCVVQVTLESQGIEIRFCEECGRPFNAGYMAGNGDWYCCEDCFEKEMDDTYGKDKWRPSDEEGEWEGWYEYLNSNGEWEDTGIFYTEWY